jgi:hypothetical protein
MEIFKDNLMRAREVISQVKERERVKRQIVLMSSLGILNKITSFQILIVRQEIKLT